MELEDYLEQEGPIIDAVYYLQNYAEGWKNGHFEEKHDFRECIDKPRYRQEGKQKSYFYHCNCYTTVYLKKHAYLKKIYHF